LNSTELKLKNNNSEKINLYKDRIIQFLLQNNQDINNNTNNNNNDNKNKNINNDNIKINNNN
jgi:hypothetical protein